MSEILFLDGLRNGLMNNISKIVEENIRRVRTGIEFQPISPAQPIDPLEVMKLRFAQGEITKEEFEEIKRTLE